MIAAVRANFLPEQRFIPLRPVLEDYLAKVGGAVSPANFLSICDAKALQLLNSTFASVRADEGSIWLLDADENLVITYNNGPNAEKVTGFKQPKGQGIVHLVVQTEQGFVEDNVYKNAKHDPRLDKQVGKTTYAMMVVPLYFLNRVRGVISCVKLIDVIHEKGKAVPTGKIPPKFEAQELAVLQNTAGVLRDLLDYRLLGTAVGWTRH